MQKQGEPQSIDLVRLTLANKWKHAANLVDTVHLQKRKKKREKERGREEGKGNWKTHKESDRTLPHSYTENDHTISQ